MLGIIMQLNILAISSDNNHLPSHKKILLKIKKEKKYKKIWGWLDQNIC